MADAAGLFGTEQVERARRYRRPLYAAALVDIVLGLALLAALSFTPLGDRVYAPLDELPWWAASTGVAAATVLLCALVRAPLALWAGYLHERASGLSTQAFRGWAGDRGKSLAVALALSVPALVGLVGAQRWLP
jgi:hypothetical protein